MPTLLEIYDYFNDDPDALGFAGMTHQQRLDAANGVDVSPTLFVVNVARTAATWNDFFGSNGLRKRISTTKDNDAIPESSREIVQGAAIAIEDFILGNPEGTMNIHDVSRQALLDLFEMAGVISAAERTSIEAFSQAQVSSAEKQFGVGVVINSRQYAQAYREHGGV